MYVLVLEIIENKNLILILTYVLYYKYCYKCLFKMKRIKKLIIKARLKDHNLCL